MMEVSKTEQQYFGAVAKCKSIFEKKLHDYGAAWRILRIPSLTDQLYIKAKRIRSIETKREQRVQEGIESEYMGIVNYCAIGLVQYQLGVAEEIDLTPQRALELYDRVVGETYALMQDKNHDYDEAWRSMRVSSFTDLILSKILRTKQLEDLNEQTLASEGIDANYADILNYAIFALIRIDENRNGK